MRLQEPGSALAFTIFSSKCKIAPGHAVNGAILIVVYGESREEPFRSKLDFAGARLRLRGAVDQESLVSLLTALRSLA